MILGVLPGHKSMQGFHAAKSPRGGAKLGFARSSAPDSTVGAAAARLAVALGP